MVIVDGEGSFSIRIIRKTNNRLGYAIQLVFRVGQLSKDAILIFRIKDFFGCGYLSSAAASSYFTVFTTLLMMRK